MQCPDCNRGLRNEAIRCACGWTALDSKTPQHADCAHDGCPHPAKIKLKTNTGWAKVCDKHYLQHFQEKAEENAVKLGLLTGAQCREWLKKNALRTKRFEDAE